MVTEKIQITEKEHSLLIALQENPIRPSTELSEILGITPQTVLSRINTLRKMGLLKRIQAELNLPALGMTLVDTLVVPTHNKYLRVLEQFSDSHPYTAFRARIFGRFNGMYVQFRVPIEGIKAIESTLDILKEKGILERYEVYLPEENIIDTRPQLDAWNPELWTWHFDWQQWIEFDIEAKKANEILKKQFKRKKTAMILNHLDLKDVFLLASLNEDAKRKQADIQRLMEQENLGKLSIQRISERLRYLKKHAVRQYRLFLDWRILDIYHTLLLNVRCSDEVKQDLQLRLLLDPPPFASRFHITKNGFLWYIRCPASFFSDLFNIIADKFDHIEVNLLDYKSSMTYYLWYKTFDEETKRWRTDEEFLIHQPLRKIM